jgi:hypothetical protein
LQQQTVHACHGALFLVAMLIWRDALLAASLHCTKLINIHPSESLPSHLGRYVLVFAADFGIRLS